MIYCYKESNRPALSLDALPGFYITAFRLNDGGGSLTNEKCVGASGDAKSVGDKMLVL